MTYEAQIGRVIPLGRVGENEITEVAFDYSCWIDAYGEGEFRLVHRRNCDSAALPIEIAAEGGRITWTLTEADTAAQGEGEAQLTYYASSGKIKKSAIYKTMTTRSLTSGENTPQPYRGFVDTVLAAAQEAETAAAAAQTAKTGAEAAAQDARTVVESVGPKFAQIENDLENSVYSQFEKGAYAATWTNSYVRPATGSSYADDAHILTPYLRSYSEIPVEIIPPPGIEFAVYHYLTASVTNSYQGEIVAFTAAPVHVRIPKGQYIRVCARYAAGGDIETTVGDTIGISYYENETKEDSALNTADVLDLLPYTLDAPAWEQGTINANTGSTNSSANHVRTSYRRITAGTSYVVNVQEGLEAQVFLFTSQSVSGYVGTLSLRYRSGTLRFRAPSGGAFKVVVQRANGTAIAPADMVDAHNDPRVTVSVYPVQNELNILVLGNSFSMDAFAYLPPVLDELLPDYNVNYSVAYRGSASIEDHLMLYRNAIDPDFVGPVTDRTYTVYNQWDPAAGAWKRDAPSAAHPENGRDLPYIMNQRAWDVIYVQPASSVTNEQAVLDTIVTPGRELLRLLQKLSRKPFTYLMGQWLSQGRKVSDYTWELGAIDANGADDDSVIHIDPVSHESAAARVRTSLISLTGGTRYLISVPETLEAEIHTYSAGSVHTGTLPFASGGIWYEEDTNTQIRVVAKYPSAAGEPDSDIPESAAQKIDVFADRGEEIFPYMVNAMSLVSGSLGINGYIPIGTAIQDARTIADFVELGYTKNLLYDGQHMQAGLAPLLAAYTISMYILDMLGEKNVAVYRSSFVPTQENVEKINAWKATGATPMTHGQAEGVTTANILAAQEIAAMAIKYPATITDCSEFVIAESDPDDEED